MRTKTIQKLVAGPHTITVEDWGGWDDAGVHRMSVTLDGFTLLVVNLSDHVPMTLVNSLAENLAYALRAPERKKGKRR
jgi:hypothetical protein